MTQGRGSVCGTAGHRSSWKVRLPYSSPPSVGELPVRQSCSGSDISPPGKWLANRVKRRRRRSSASGAGWHSIFPMRGSGPAYLGFLGLPWFLVPAKSSPRGVLAGVLCYRTPVSNQCGWRERRLEPLIGWFTHDSFGWRKEVNPPEGEGKRFGWRCCEAW